MRIIKKRFIYLISPNKINSTFYEDLHKIFKLNKVEIFQLRLKKSNIKKTVLIAKKIKILCKKYKVKFLINDNPAIAKIVGADGCHLGQGDCNVLNARKVLKNKIIGVTCHNSIKLVRKAISDGADYVAIGAFFNTKTKKVKFKANLSLIIKLKVFLKIPLVVIGGINSRNYRKLLLHKPNFLAISSYVWKNKKLNPLEAVRNINL